MPENQKKSSAQKIWLTLGEAYRALNNFVNEKGCSDLLARI